MLKSMTGFGRGECLRFNRRIKVEMKSINHRFSDFTIKVPRVLNPFEDKIRQRLAKDITRGKVDLWVGFESFTAKDVTVQVNTVYADAYMDALRELSSRFNLGEVPLGTALELLAKVQDIIVFDKYESALRSEDARDEILETLLEAMDQALAQFNNMRETEGEALGKDIEMKYERACSLITEMRAYLPSASLAQAKRLKEKIGDILTKLDGKPEEGRLLTEIAILADKGDIDEELTRLESHFKQLAAILAEQGAVGRKMDFLVQEMNREANTIGSKSTDVTLTKMVVELKSVIEKIREQVQNIE